jgi:protein deglycase
MPTVLVPLAQGCEELEAVTVIDLLRRAKIEVMSASLDDKPVKGSRGVTLLADTTLDQVLTQNFDMIVLPGGLPGADHLDHDLRIHTLLKHMHTEGKYIAAICAAPKILAHAGLLEDKTVTSYPGVLSAMNLQHTNFINAPVVKDGHIITSRGPGTAMDFALTLIELLCGLEKSREVEAGLARETI